MRKYLIIGSVPVLAIAAIALVPLLVPLDSFRAPLEKAVSRGLGRGVHIAGSLHLTLFPVIGLSAGDVSIENVPGGEAKEFAHVGTLAVGAKLVPLLSRKIDITRLALDNPSIHLEVDSNGNSNWNFATTTSGGETSTPSQLSISGLKISGGEFSYLDARTGKRKALRQVTASLNLAAIDQPASLDLDGLFNDEKFTVTGRIDSPATYLQKKPSKVVLNVNSRLLNLQFDGSVIGATESSGMVKMSGPSLRQLMQGAGTTAPNTFGLGAFSLEGGASSKDRVYALTNAKLSLDDMKANVDLAVDLNGKVPLLKGKIALDRLDAGAYMMGKEPEAKTSGWSTKPLSLNGLKLANADVGITVERFQLGTFVVSHGVMQVALQDAKLTAALTQASLFNGSATGRVIADAGGAVPAFMIKADVKSVAMKSLLQSAMKVERIEGTGLLAMDVAGHGTNQQAIVNSLSGTGSVTVRNGALRGVDLAAVGRTIQNALSGNLGAATGDRASTDFAEAGGKFVIHNGVMHNDDFHLLNPFVRIAGSGDINLGPRTLNFRVEPKIVSTGAGQGGARNAAGIGIPFQVSGPWSKLSYAPDLKAVGGTLVNQLTGGEGGVGSLLGNALGGKKGSGKSQPQPSLNLNGLFGR
jgi:AsmA protein